MDYVCCWFKKAFDFIKHNPKIRCAFVATNSINQGEHISTFWQPLIDDGLIINFAYRPFKWLSDSVGMANVHCVIVGFSLIDNNDKRIFNDDNTVENVNEINAYLSDSRNFFVQSRTKPICNVPEMMKGSMPTDDGNFIIDGDELEDFIQKEPRAKPYIKPYLGAVEFINNKKRYCLWLKDVNPSEINKMPLVKERVRRVKEFRLKSKKQSTQKKAATPTIFDEIRQPETNYLLIPCHSSGTRKYIPLGFMSKDVISSNANLIIPNATLYEFGILTSVVHMAWMRYVCGRLKSDYRYSKDIVYNNFPWPEKKQKATAKIESAARKILDIRENYLQSGCSLAMLYGEDFDLIYNDLVKAHKELDALVLALYGLDNNTSEEQIVAKLFEMYREQVG